MEGGSFFNGGFIFSGRGRASASWRRVVNKNSWRGGVPLIPSCSTTPTLLSLEKILVYILTESLGRSEGFEQLFYHWTCRQGRPPSGKSCTNFHENTIYARAMLVGQRIHKCYESKILGCLMVFLCTIMNCTLSISN